MAFGDFFLRIAPGDYMFMLQFLLAESMFFYYFERRNHFWGRLICGIVFCILIAIVLNKVFPPSIDKAPENVSIVYAWINGFLRYMLQIIATLVVSIFCFKERVWTLASACMAGYAVQHLTFNIERIIGVFVPLRYILGRALYNWLTIPFYLVIYVPLFFLFALPMAKNEYKNEGNIWLNTLSCVAIFILICINRFLSLAQAADFFQSIANKLYAMAFCILALSSQIFLYRAVKMRSEYVVIQMLLEQSEKQYEKWKASMDEINIRYHDLRHELEFMKETGIQQGAFSEVNRTLTNYGAPVHTGNENLDVLLSGMKMLCRGLEITFECVVEDDALKPFDGMQIYNLLNNALDNAIESIKQVKDPGNKVLILRVNRKGKMALIRTENYFEGKLTMKDGIPVSSREGNWHGYGMKSIQGIVETYHGAMNITSENQIFCLSIVLPYPENEEDSVFKNGQDDRAERIA